MVGGQYGMKQTPLPTTIPAPDNSWGASSVHLFVALFISHYFVSPLLESCWIILWKPCERWCLEPQIGTGAVQWLQAVYEGLVTLSSRAASVSSLADLAVNALWAGPINKVHA